MDAFAHKVEVADSRTGERVMRNFIRHPSDIPIECQVDEGHSGNRQRLQNVSCGGLAFSTKTPVSVGAQITVRIPGIEPAFEVMGQVAWCRRVKGEYAVGVQFSDQNDSFRVRMVEQVCHIEHYKTEVEQKEGRHISGDDAAQEWIVKFAKDFPDS